MFLASGQGRGLLEATHHPLAQFISQAFGDNADALFRSPLSHVAGNPNGDVSVVEFFDYNCPFCRRALPTVVKLVNDDGKVRLVLKEFALFPAHDVGIKHGEIGQQNERGGPRMRSDGSTEKKNPDEMRMAESGTPIRTTQSSGLGRTAASASIWQTSERITMTPAWACPARKKFCRSGFSM